MELWELDFEWLRIQHQIKDRFKRDTLPDLNAVLFLIGMQELGRWKENFSKEEKQDLMHIAVCRLMAYEGFFEFEGRDADGWPHYRRLRALPANGTKEQEIQLKKSAIRYFMELEAEWAAH